MPDAEFSDNLAEEIDAEVHRVSEIFRLLLKYREKFQPAGIEFSDMRQYVPSDDANKIDWKASVRLNDLYVKEYEEEQDLDTFIILDSSDSMMTGTAEKLKSEYSALIAATLAYASVDNGLNVGFAMYSGENELMMTPDGGQKRYHAVLDQLTDFDNYGGKFRFENVLDEIIGMIKEKTAVFIISDFIEPQGEWESLLRLSSSKFRHVMGIMVRDLRDYELPKDGNMRFEAPGGGGQVVANTHRIKQEYDELAQEKEEEVLKTFREKGANIMKIDTRDSFAAEFASFFDKEGDQW